MVLIYTSCCFWPHISQNKMLSRDPKFLITGENTPLAISFTILLCKCCKQRYPGPGLRLSKWHQGPYTAPSPRTTVDFPVITIAEKSCKISSCDLAGEGTATSGVPIWGRAIPCRGLELSDTEQSPRAQDHEGMLRLNLSQALRMRYRLIRADLRCNSA